VSTGAEAADSWAPAPQPAAQGTVMGNGANASAPGAEAAHSWTPAAQEPGLEAPGSEAPGLEAADVTSVPVRGRVIAGSGLFVHPEPRLTSPHVGSLPYGAIVYVWCYTVTDTMWDLIQTSPQRWVASSYVDVGGAAVPRCNLQNLSAAQRARNTEPTADSAPEMTTHGPVSVAVSGSGPE
jgi:hypothetical protein